MDSPTTEDGSPFGDIPTRPMRVKVLYTFDTENRTNCLARFPDTLQIPAVAIDENSQVGVIELRQCIQAIVSASPELVSRLAEGDFTIYAYDYSEYETPLVGQGMLSAALAAASPTPLVPAHQSKTMITGRVCKNLPGIFSNGVKETLEVKLRLVPVPRQVQSEYVRNMESFRSMSPATSAGFDPNAWNASFNHTTSQTPDHDYLQFNSQSLGAQQDQDLIDDIFGMASGNTGDASGQRDLGGVGMAQTPSDAFSGANPAFAAHAHSAPGSRAGSPMMGSNSNTFNEQLRHQSFSASGTNFADYSRPGSRGSVRSEYNQPSQQYRQSSTQAMPDMPQQPEVEYNEDGQPRKRAKVMQTDWRGRSSFGTKSGDLRVTAATAASMQMHRPVPRRPFAVSGSDLEPPPRVPTPVPQFNQQSQHRPRPSTSRSLLRQASTAGSDFMSDVDQMSEAVMSSPEDYSPENSATAEGTPQEFPSSPPLFPGINLPQPSSPGLPTLPPPRMADSGYMSERNLHSSNYMENLEDNEDRSPDAHDYEAAGRYQQRNKQRQPHIKSEGTTEVRMPPPYPSDAPTSEINIEMEMPGDMNQLPKQMMLNLPPGRGRDPSLGPKVAAKKPSRVNSPAPRSTTPAAAYSAPGNSLAPAAQIVANSSGSAQPYQQTLDRGSEAPQSRRGSLALPTKRPAPIRQESEAAAVPPKAVKKRPTARRARTTYNDSEFGSPAPSDTESRGPGRSGSGAQRRKLIEQRMQDAVAKGEMPNYCVHCGSIETPTWRKMYFKVVDGKPGALDSVEGEGETVGVENLESDPATGEVTKFIIRKTMKKVARDAAGEGFGDIQVCNPCGLWFNKNRMMRPQEKWNKRSGTRKSRKAKNGEVGVTTDGLEPQSEAFFTDGMMPDDVSDESRTGGNAMQYAAASSLQRQPSASHRQRAQSVQPSQRSSNDGQWNSSQLDAALHRAIQSSPARFHGSQDSPIELDELTPRPTRRLLFPSPRREGEDKSLDGIELPARKSTSPSAYSQQQKSASPLKTMPNPSQQADYAIFEAFTTDKENMPPPLESDDELAHLFLGSPSSIFKTPRKTPPSSKTNQSLDHLLKTPTPASRKRKLLTPSAAAANNANHNQPALPTDFLTSPSSSRYFLRSTPTRLANTPSRRLGLGSDPASNQASPFSRHLAQMISNASGAGDGFGSPGGNSGFDFGDLPGFGTPGNVDWDGLMSGDIGAVFEDGGM